MSNGPSLVIRGTILGSLLIALLGWFLGGRLDLTPQAEVVLAASPLEPPASQPDVPDAPESLDACQVSLSYPEGILQWCSLITSLASEAGLPPNFVAAVMLMESGGDSAAYSSSGAVGLLQVMPRDGLAADFQCPNGPCFASRPTIDELLDPTFNIEFGSHMLAGLITKLGSEREALRAYGPMDVGYSYADRVLAIYENYR